MKQRRNGAARSLTAELMMNNACSAYCIYASSYYWYSKEECGQAQWRSPIHVF